MNDNNQYPDVSSFQQDQMLKVITKTFYNELVTYGITKSNVISISSNLLDCVMQKDEGSVEKIEYYNNEFQLNEIQDEWKSRNCLKYRDVSLVPVRREMYATIENWLAENTIKNSLIAMLPSSSDQLIDYMAQDSNRYFAILHCDRFVGMIGADSVDTVSSKVEMKKFIGDPSLRGKGVGKQATFLFLYYVFCIMQFNKVYVYTLNKNIANINLNSKFGFILEGMLYQEKKIHDELQDVLRMCILKNTWDEMFAPGLLDS